MSPQFRIIVIFLALIFFLAPLNGIIFAEEKTAQETTLAPESTTGTTEETSNVKITYKWKCPYCGQVNSSDDTICVFCHNQKPADTQIMDEPTLKKIEAEKDKKKLKWLCPQCGKYNNFGNTKCLYCEEPRPPTTSSNYQLFYPLYRHPTMHSVGIGMIVGGGIALVGSMILLISMVTSKDEMAGIALVFIIPGLIAGGAVFGVGVALAHISEHSVEMIPVNPGDTKDLGYNSLDNYRLLTERPTLPRPDITIFNFGFTF